MSSEQSNKLPKTLVSETKGKHEQNCNDLRDYSPPSEVRVYKIKNGKEVLVRTEEPTFYSGYIFNKNKAVK